VVARITAHRQDGEKVGGGNNSLFPPPYGVRSSAPGEVREL